MFARHPLTLTALLVLILDQASKLGVLWGLQLDSVELVEVFPPYLVFRMAWNQGVNFGLLSHGPEWARWGLIALAIGISAWVWTWVRREPQGLAQAVSAGLLIGGAAGNVIDRLAYGAVADFLNMSCCGIENPFSFNVADVAIFLGAVGLVIWSGGGAPPAGRRRTRKSP